LREFNETPVSVSLYVYKLSPWLLNYQSLFSVWRELAEIVLTFKIGILF